VSSTDRSFCDDCEAGQYNIDNTCVDCEYGRYAPQALSGQCLACGQGFKTSAEIKATTCDGCDSGKYSKNLSSTCSPCLKGTYSSSRADHCTPCEVGKYAANESTGTCLACDAKTSSDEGSSSCPLASPDYFINSHGVSTNCPRNARCIGRLLAPIPIAGYWVDHISLKFANEIFKCPRDTCTGGDQNNSCWIVSKFDEAHCVDEGSIQCSDGAIGPLCGSCSLGYVYRSATNSCGQCEVAKNYLYVVTAIFFLLMLIIVVTRYLLKSNKLSENSILRLVMFVDGGSLKVCVAILMLFATLHF
jgi:hypothetical protein